jgi:hypothetical protein
MALLNFKTIYLSFIWLELETPCLQCYESLKSQCTNLSFIHGFRMSVCLHCPKQSLWNICHASRSCFFVKFSNSNCFCHCRSPCTLTSALFALKLTGKVTLKSRSWLRRTRIYLRSECGSEIRYSLRLQEGTHFTLPCACPHDSIYLYPSFPILSHVLAPMSIYSQHCSEL